MTTIIQEKAQEVYKARSELAAASAHEQEAGVRAAKAMNAIMEKIEEVAPELLASYKEFASDVDVSIAVRRAKAAEAEKLEKELRELADERALVLHISGVPVFGPDNNRCLHPNILIKETRNVEILDVGAAANWLVLNGHGSAVSIKTSGDVLSFIEGRSNAGTLPTDHLGNPQIKFGTTPKTQLDKHESWDNVQA